ncbi:VOC family protein [Methanofollis fontis]|uniref:Glyoxalase n=1 Tax=Methanofollis fontis TaxID=2052832 RepID=A0A483CRK9_9EURY|nr:VOC family protein [Methanofollis fontis]TAJ45753.1 glyoxalase [Methanofollis fontis]
MPHVTWFEVPADDTGRAGNFYRELFGWKIEPFPVPFKKDFWAISAGGGIGGDLFRREEAGQCMMLYIDVLSIDDYLERIRDLGGRVLTGRTAVPGMGWLAVCEDTEGNRFGLWQGESEE